jgi:hypothetical protein
MFVFLWVVVGSFGTLIGAGGGFLLIPILLICYPTMPAQTVTAISMTNPIEMVWDEIREKGFKNELFKTLNAVQIRLCDTLLILELD